MDYAKLTFIGAGNMAQALTNGILAKGWPADHITLTDVNQTALDDVAARLNVNVTRNNTKAVAAAEVVILAVKPQVLEGVARALAPALADDTLVISIAAGITSTQLTDWLGERPLVRVMPNTPALVQTGASGLYAAASVSNTQKRLAETLMEAAGLVRWFDDEAKLDAVTAVSGSGPAYFFLLMEQMIATAESLGLDADSARQLVLQTALGAAKLAGQSDDSPAELRRKVTSPGGTTAAALAVFSEANFEQTVRDALTAARDRSIELSAN